MAKPSAPPTKDQVVNYMSALHFLGAAAQAGTDDLYQSTFASTGIRVFFRAPPPPSCAQSPANPVRTTNQRKRRLVLFAANKAMWAVQVAYLGHPATRRADRRRLHDVTLYRMKRPIERLGAWDCYTVAGMLPAAAAFLPMNPACA